MRRKKKRGCLYRRNVCVCVLCDISSHQSVFVDDMILYVCSYSKAATANRNEPAVVLERFVSSTLVGRQFIYNTYTIFDPSYFACHCTIDTVPPDLYGTVRYGIVSVIVSVIVFVILLYALSVLSVSTIDLIVGSGWDESKQSKSNEPLIYLRLIVIVLYCILLCCVIAFIYFDPWLLYYLICCFVPGNPTSSCVCCVVCMCQMLPLLSKKVRRRNKTEVLYDPFSHCPYIPYEFMISSTLLCIHNHIHIHSNNDDLHSSSSNSNNSNSNSNSNDL